MLCKYVISIANFQMMQYIHTCHVIWMMSQTLMILTSWAIMPMWVFVIYFLHILSHDIHSFNFNKHLSLFPLISSLACSFFVSETLLQSLFLETFLFYFLSCFFAKTFQHMMFWRTSKYLLKKIISICERWKPCFSFLLSKFFVLWSLCMVCGSM